MKPTIRFVEERFERFNTLMFGGRLPKIPVRMSDATTFLGMFVSKVKTYPDGRREHFDCEFRFSLCYDVEEKEIEDVIIHEMIHYFIAYNGLSDTAPHGVLFKAMMHTINTTFRRNLTVSRRLNSEEHANARATKRTWHVIAKVCRHDGRTGIKVLPRVVEKILSYYHNVSAALEVRHVELFLHDNPFFNRYPTSAALKVYPIDPAQLDDELAGAKRLLVENGKLIQR